MIVGLFCLIYILVGFIVGFFAINDVNMIFYMFLCFMYLMKGKKKKWKHNLYLAPPSTINHQPSSSSAGVHSEALVLLWCAVADGVGFNSCSNAPEYPKVSLFLQVHICRYNWCSIIKAAQEDKNENDSSRTHISP